MSTFKANGLSVAIANVTIPYYGTWTADIVLPTGVPITNPVTLTLGDLELVGTVIRQGVFAGDLSVRIVGGGGGWGKELPARGYSHIIGVRLSTLLADVASESGESIVVDSDRSVGTLWARERAKGESVLRFLTDGKWWVDAAGVTQTKARDGSVISNPFTVISRASAAGHFEIATEALAPWMPGRTFSTSTVPDVQTVSSVTFTAGNDGKLRLFVTSAGGANERLRTDLRSIVRAEVPSLSYAGVWEYTIAPNPLALGLVSSVDCTPTDKRMPALTNVPLVGMGAVAPPVTGTKCRIQFVNSDPSRPECVSLDGTTEHLMTVEAFSVVMHNLILLMAAFATPPAWLASGVTPTMINAALVAAAIPSPPGVIAQVLNAAAQASAMASGPGSTSTLYKATIDAAMAGKILDVSGLFPGLGVPNG